ncbi:MAG TPA: hypothetical protein PKW80_01510 [Bacteroidales bacterium]|nr:hypothetical protein [Bacteroidales bacterium]
MVSEEKIEYEVAEYARKNKIRCFEKKDAYNFDEILPKDSPE